MWLFEKLNQSSVEVPDGTTDIKVYIFDGRPFKRLRDGSRIKLTLLGGEHKMKSIYNGSEGKGNVAVSYKGKLVGFLAADQNSDLLVSVRDKFGPLLLSGTFDYFCFAGWPYVYVNFDKDWAQNIVEG